MAEAKSRQVWIDVAKAIAIFLVVFYHVIVALPALIPDISQPILTGWVAFGKALMPIRMPLFFCVSGILASRALSRPWSMLWRRRILNLLWPYFVWSMCFSLLGGFRYQPEEPWAYAKASLNTIPYGGNAYWFLSVLVVFFVIARIFRSAIPVVAAVSAGLLAFAPLVSNVAANVLGLPAPLAINLQRIAYFAVWYFVGLLVANWVRSNYRGASNGTMIALLGVYGTVAFSLYYMKLGSSISGSIYLVLATLGLLAFSAFAYFLSRFRTVERIATYVSQRTLPIYVIHPIILVALVVGSRALSERVDWVGAIPIAIQAVLPAALGLLLTLASLGLYKSFLRFGASWMFELPQRKKKPALASGRENNLPDESPYESENKTF